MTDLETVLFLACLTEDRTPQEQRALLAVALRLDSDHGSFAASNKHRQSPHYVELVLRTHETDKPVNLTGAQKARYERLLARWVPCLRCGQPAGAHPTEDRCPA